MERMRPGDIVRHFKGKEYKILGYVDHVDRGTQVIYIALYEPYLMWSRDKEEFFSEVDRIKYPDARQKYRFEKIDLL